MGGTSAPKNAKKITPPHAGLPQGLEEQLASVIEQEGKVLQTPRGQQRFRPERKVRKAARQHAAAHAASHQEAPDEVQALDHLAVFQNVKTTAIGKPVSIQIQQKAHARSPYIVSLQHVRLGSSEPAFDDRVPLHEVSEHRLHYRAGAAPVVSYATASSDLHVEFDHRFIADQFTPDTFEEAYARVYGTFDRARSAFGSAWSFILGFVQRIERVEHRAIGEIEETFTSIEIPRISFARAMAGFAAVAFMVTLPANALALYHVVRDQKQTATTVSEDAIAQVMNAAQADSVGDSAEALKRASVRFREADSMLSEASGLALSVASVLPARYRSSRALLEVGDKSSEAARLLAIGLEHVFAESERRLDERLDSLGIYVRGSLVFLTDATKAARSIDLRQIPESHRAQTESLLGRLEASTQAVREFASLSELLSQMTGKEHLRKYLVIFQNHTELRPTGGFMGSFAEVTMDRGAVTAIRVPPGGTYDLQGQLLARVTPPKPLQLISDRWEFQDANWSPDFPTSAKKIRWFWSKSGQSSVDGVIALNAPLVEKMLALTGPIDMPEYGKVIDASNFLMETQKAVELEYDRVQNTPKKFVGDLANKMMERMKTFGKDEWLEMASLISESLETKDIQLALTNPDEEAFAERYGWNGRMKETIGDALAVVEANVAGQKTDGVVTESVTHEVNIQEDGSIEDTVTLTRTHEGKKGELFRGVRNVSYLRVYVPQGSRLLAASGFETPPAELFSPVDKDNVPDADLAVSEASAVTTPDGIMTATEGSRTVFGGWMQLDPGEQQVIRLTYRLPFTTADIMSKLDAAPEQGVPSTRNAYLLLLTSQSGKSQRDIHVQVNAPPSWNTTWTRPTTLSQDGGLSFASSWNRDHVVGALFSPR